MHGRAGRPKQLARNCEKPWGNQGFGAERTGFEQPAKSLGTARFVTPLDAKYDARKKHDSIPVARGLFVDWQLTTHRPAELLAGDRG